MRPIAEKRNINKKTARVLCAMSAAVLLLAACGKKEEQTGTVAAPSTEVSQQPSAAPEPEKTASVSEFGVLEEKSAPSGIAAMPDGSFLVADGYNKRLLCVKEDKSEIYAGAESAVDAYGEPLGGYSDGELMASLFKSPGDIVAFMGGFAVTDADNGVVRFVKDAKVETVNAHEADGGRAVFERPAGLAVDDAGALYIADAGSGKIRRVNTDGAASTVAEGLNEPMGLCWKDGALYIAETGAHRIVKWEGGQIVPVAGSGDEGADDGSAQQATFAAPRDVAVGEDGTIYVADTANSAIRQVKDGQVSTMAVRDMALAEAGIVSPTGLLALQDKLYICDKFAKKIFLVEWK